MMSMVVSGIMFHHPMQTMVATVGDRESVYQELSSRRLQKRDMSIIQPMRRYRSSPSSKSAGAFHHSAHVMLQQIHSQMHSHFSIQRSAGFSQRMLRNIERASLACPFNFIT